MKRSILTLVLFSLLTPIASVSHGSTTTPSSKEVWTGIRSKNFFIVGNAGEKDIRKAAIKLEQFREVFSRLFPKAKIKSSVPTRVIVFKNINAYKPFMPLYQGKISEVSGYFMPGQDVNYITLTAELRETNPYGTVFHEFVHSLTNENSFRLPTWFNEGLAEYYSSFDVTDGDKKFWLGKANANHVFLLRDKKFLPLNRLFSINTSSPDYNERDKKGVFYAQSWAITHYLMLGNNGQRRPQLIQFLGLLGKGVTQEEAFKQAFKTDYTTMEKELRNYIGRDSYLVETFTTDEKLDFDAQMQSSPVSEAESQFYLGDLLAHMDRQNEAEEYLQRAITLDPNLALAHSAMGLLRMRQKRVAEAKQHLEQALKLGSENHLVHYYYAFTLSREGMDENNIIRNYDSQAAQMMREHLEKAIRLAPEFAESYYLMGFVNLVTGENLDAAAGQLKRAISLSPGRQEAAFMLAQIYLRQQKFDLARQTVEPIARDASTPQLRLQAQSLLETIDRVTERLAQVNAGREQLVSTTPPPSEASEDKRPLMVRRIFEGEKAQGMLSRIDCDEKGITLIVKSGDRAMKFNSTTPEKIQFITFSNEAGSTIACGPVNPAKTVTVTYRSSTDAKSKFDGEPIAVEFVKQR